MPNPFPGMNPYLEDVRSWRDVHTSLLTYVRDTLAPQIRPRYVARIEESVEIEESPHSWQPDVSSTDEGGGNGSHSAGGVATLVKPLVLERAEERTARWIEIFDVRGREVVTVIELLSPTNKRWAGRGNQKYALKLRDYLNSAVNLVEIDLLRGGVPATAAENDSDLRKVPAHDYLVSVSRGDNRNRYEVYPFTLRDAIPPVGIPLRRGETDVVLELTPLIERVYENGAYQSQINYREAPPLPPLSESDAAWLDALLREKGLRAA